MSSRQNLSPCPSFQHAGAAGPCGGGGIRIGEGSRLARWSAPVESFFVRNRHRLVYVHAFMFVLFIVVIVGPLFLPETGGDATPLNDLRLAANFALWGIWFPVVFLSVIFTGRSWCGLFCPMGAAAEWVNKVGLQRPIPRWLAWEGTPLLSFVFITVLGQTIGVRDHPEAAAEIFGGTMLAALVIGFLYGRRKRAWCRHMCPIGRVLGLYSRLGAVQFEPRAKIAGGDAYTEKGICPTMIDLSRKSESRHCITCFRCVNQTAKGGVEMTLRRPGAEIETIGSHHPSHSEAWFLFLDTGVALGAFLWLVLPVFQTWRQNVGVWSIEHGWSWMTDIGPWWLMSVHPQRGETFMWLDFVMIVGFMLGCMVMMTAVIAALNAVAAWLARRGGARRDFKACFTELGYQYAPVALMSLVISLGAELFEPIRWTMFGPAGVSAVKAAFFLTGVVWSIWLGERILASQEVPARNRWLPSLPGVVGIAFTGLLWWPAIFGV
ncbi:Polyferredoxin [Rhodovulum sp. PH10]|uniref:4Fe-4S binding protein n=1 Tax=Rhodovulum sp. PH10 TaxID=1187851 RepID=UPI00027C2B51|nr:4Fe-4S binding protein [Rhodovulum sp. PH10]EJW11724.1 Polyferredoxin [Rhodovulum sp. PH10]